MTADALGGDPRELEEPTVQPEDAVAVEAAADATAADPTGEAAPAGDDEATAVDEVTAADDEAEGATFSSEYVRKLREESAAHRVKARRVDEANARLARAYVTADGRLLDADVLPVDDALLGDDGLVDPDRVAQAIGALIAAKPYLLSRKPTAVIPQGVREPVPERVSLFGEIRRRM